MSLGDVRCVHVMEEITKLQITLILQEMADRCDAHTVAAEAGNVHIHFADCTLGATLETISKSEILGRSSAK